MNPRKSQNKAASSSSTPLKRALSQSEPTPPSRQSKRTRSSPANAVNGKTTPKKSPYFEQSISESEAESDIQEEESGYEDEDESASLVSSPPESDVNDDDENEEDYASEDVASKKRKRPVKKITINNATSATAKKGQELWRPGVKSSLEPGQAIFIKLPKARLAGSTPYSPSTIHPNTFLFLSDLRANNDREWLKVHDADYRQSQADWASFVESLSEKIIEKDDTIPELPPKDLTFRIYRDIRFSPDPTPYKIHFSAAWSRTGRKGPYAGYYVQIQPGNASFVGAGMWHPEAAPVAAMRRDFDRKSHKLKEVLMGAELRKEFLGGVSKEEGKVVAKFVGMNGEGALKTKPKVRWCIIGYIKWDVSS